MCRLHRLLDDVEQVLTQLGQVHLIVESGTECSKCAGCIIFAAIETAINYVKIRNGKRALSYNDIVEEAFCFGWGDSLR
jgi:hypothetical protein